MLDAMGTGLLGEIHTEGCPNELSIVLERIPSISSAMLGPVAISLGYSVTECGVEMGIDDHLGETIGLSPGVILERFTYNMASLLVDSASQIDCLGRGTNSGSKPPFRPFGYTTLLPN